MDENISIDRCESLENGQDGLVLEWRIWDNEFMILYQRKNLKSYIMNVAILYMPVWLRSSIGS